MANVTLTDRPKTVRNRSVIEVFSGVFVLSRFNFSVGVGAFVIGLSQICSIFSLFSVRIDEQFSVLSTSSSNF